MYPDDQNWKVDGEDAEHKDEDRMYIVVEISMCTRMLYLLVNE